MAIPLIAAQPGIWLADKLSTFDNAYTVVHYLDLRGNLNVGVLCESINRAMMETDTLQMSYVEKNGEVFQELGGALPLPSPETWDLRYDKDPIQSSKEFMRKDLESNVRIDSGNTLIRHSILQLADNHWIWYQRYHHIQLDAFSFTALTRRMVDLYSSQIRGTDKLVTQPFGQFSEVVKEYQEYQQSTKFKKDVVFWKDYCKNLPEATSPSPKPLPGAEPSKNIIRNKIDLDNELFKQLCLAGSAHSGLHDADVGLALVAIWLLRLSGRSSMNTGFIFMRRLGSAAINTSGPFINVLPMALSFESQEGKAETLFEVATSISKTLKLLRRHQRLDSEKIVRDSGRNWDDDPLFGPVINFKAFDYRLDFADVDCETHHLASGPIRDIEVVLYITENYNIQIEYLANAERYDAETLDKHLQRFPLLLRDFTSDPLNLTCDKAHFILPEENEAVERANDSKHPVDSEATLWSLLKQQALMTPDSIALEDGQQRLTYRETMNQVSGLAREIQSRGVERGDIVAISMSRSVLLPIAIQAIVAVGAAWLPLDTGYPAERLQLMVEDARPKLIIVGAHSNIESEHLVYRFESLLEATVGTESEQLDVCHPEDIAYVIYTSGSTGKPKGVQVSHHAVVNRLLWMQGEYKLDASDAVLQKTPSSFDVSVWEFWWPLITGARLVMAPPDAHKDPEQILQLIVKFSVTTIHFVPSMLAAFLNGADVNATIGTLKRVFCSGEALSTTLARKWQSVGKTPLFNLYGPTEAAIDVTAYPAFGEFLQNTSSVPIGSPVWNTQLHVLDKQLLPIPTGMAGDLYISGAQLAKGYLNRPELTSERFKTVRGVRMYQTGDVARWLPNRGVLEFLGRSDDQVKLRGQRLELGEIDNVIEKLPGVKQAVTQPQILIGKQASAEDEDARQLVGYLVAEPAVELDLEAIHQQLYKLLPSYMVPVKLVTLDVLPLGATGKLDRRALPLPSAQMPDSTLHRHKPAPGFETVIAETFKELLGCEEVYAEDDFFSLGGYSLLAVRLAATLRQKLDLPVTIGQIMQTPRISSLAAILSDESTRESWGDAGFEKVLPLRSNPKGQTVFCIHPASGFAWQFSVLRRYLDPHWSLVGIQSAHADGVLAESESLEDVIDAHYESITSYNPEGPYYLLGYSLGGTLAHSLAAKLTNNGKTVAFLGLLDTWPPETQNWDEKRGKNVVDQAVIDEMYRERQQFVAAQQGTFDGDGLSSRMFDTIESNYTSAVRLLTTAHSSRFEGNSTLFVAEKTFPQGTDLQEVWKPWTKQLSTVPVECSHVDIISPRTFEILGPQIDALLQPFIRA